MFTRALEALAAPDRAQVELHFTAWHTAGGDWAQISVNARSETALPEREFVALIQEFARRLVAGETPQESWKFACRSRHFCGAVVPSAERPPILGRAITLDQYAKMVSDFSGLTPDTEKRLLRQYASTPLPGHRLRTLRGAPLGAYVQWATFDPARVARSPFDALPHTTTAVRTVLGLGTTAPTDVLALIAYQCPSDLELRRPTIAEAGVYSWYRPHHEADHSYGYTCALDTGERGLPEVVHRPVTGQTIVLPYHLTSPA